MPATSDGVRMPLCRADRWLVRVALVALLCVATDLALPPEAMAVLAKGANERPVYVVRKGDTLSGIGHKQGLTVALLKSINDLHGDRLKIGQRLFLEGPEVSARSLVEQGHLKLQGVIESYLATPYRFGGTDRDGIDCSAFVQQVYAVLDIALPRSAREQYWYGDEADKYALRSGDLLFFRTYARYPSHVGIYLGDGKMVHVSARSRRVVASDIDMPYFRKRFIGAKRFASIAPSSVDLAALHLVIEEPVEDDAEPVPLDQKPAPNLSGKGQ
jgi:peptidoglycan endopeptidase LytE